MIPVIAGVVVTLVGLAILADAWVPEKAAYRSERRRAARTERSIGGEACIGIAVLCVAAALFGRDTWPYSTVAMIAGSILFVVGVFANRRYLKERIVNRGALRRGAPRTTTERKPPPKGPLMPR
jgi:hypothetical protein